MGELTQVTITRVELMALQADNEVLRHEVREWLCESCNWVYPGPPQPGVMCVVCPRCKGFTAPFTSTKLRLAEAELKALRAELSARRAAQPLTPCPTNHSLSKGRPWKAIRVENGSLEEDDKWFGRLSMQGIFNSREIDFCPDCGALLDSLADKEAQ